MATIRFTKNIQRHAECPNDDIEGDSVRIVLDGYVWGVMIDAAAAEICAVNDQVCVSLDAVARKSVPWPDEIFAKGKSLVKERPVI